MKVLFLCVANSARSQLAEGLARHIGPDGWTYVSAGSAPGFVRPQAVEVLGEIGIDISSHKSKSVDEIALDNIDIVITLCAEEVCPAVLSQAARLHWPVQDPAGYDGESAEEQLDRYREARDTIADKLQLFFASLE